MRKGSVTILLGIFLIALSFRLVTLKSGYLLGNDPWTHYVIARMVLGEGSFIPHSLLSYSIYPHEAYVKVPAGLDYLPLYFYSLIDFTGISFFKAFQIIPTIFGSLTVLPLYLLVRELYNKKAALISALLLAITPASIERGLAGFYRGDVLMVFMMLFAFYFFVISVKRNLYASPVAGIFLFLGAFLWDGWPFAFVILFLAFAFGMIGEYANGINSQSKRLIISHTITIATGLILIYVFKQRYYAFSFNDMVWEGFKNEIVLVFILFIFASLFSVLHFAAGRKSSTTSERAFSYAPVSLFLLAVAVLYVSGHSLKLVEFIRSFGSWSSSFIPQTVEAQNIVELQNPSLGYISSRFVSLILLAPIGFFLHKKTFNSIFLLAFGLSSLYVTSAATRFSFLASPAVCILGAVSIMYILSLDWRKIMAVCITLLLLINTSASIDFTKNYKPIVYDDLYEGLVWLNEKTPEGSIVLTWWSYSGPVHAIADRLTLFGTYPSPGLMREVSRMFLTSDDNKALDTGRTLKADYVLMDKRIYDLSPNYMIYTDEPLEPFNSTLFKLYRGKKIENFNLVFRNDRVKIYKLLYNYTRIQDVKTKGRFFKNNEKVEINIKVRSNEDVPSTLRVQIRDPDNSEVSFMEYNVSGSSKINTEFLIPSNTARGTYLIETLLYDSQGNLVRPIVYRTFVVTGYGEADVTIKARSNYDPLLDELKIRGEVTKHGAPYTNEELLVWQKGEVMEITTDENGDFELTVKEFDRNKPFYIYTRDKSGYVIVFANINAELVSDLRLSKYRVKRGESMDITYSVKNNADFPFEGYLATDDVKLDNRSIRRQLFTEYPKIPYKLEPGETVNFKHTFTVREDAPTGRYRIWRVMRDENLDMWVGPTNRERGGFEVELIVS